MKITIGKITHEMIDDKQLLVDTLNNNFEALNNKTQILLNNVGDLQEDMREVKSDIKSLKSDVSTMKKEIGSLKSNFQSLHNYVGNLSNCMINNFSELNGRMDTNEANISIVNQNVNLILNHFGIQGGKDIIDPNKL